MCAGFLGEFTDPTKHQVFVIKSHNLERKYQFIENVTYHSAIVVLRNPYHARIAEFNRRNSHGHTKSIEEQEFFTVGMNFFLNFLVFDKLVKYKVTKLNLDLTH